MVKNEETDSDVVKAIKKSVEKFKQFYPILLDANGEIIDGQNRRVALTNPDTRKLDFIKTKKDRLQARLITNHARKGQSKKTWVHTLNELATILEKDGIESIGKKISEETGLPYRTIMRYLPAKFKDQAQSLRASHPRLPRSTQKKLESLESVTETQSTALPQLPAKSPAKKIPSIPSQSITQVTDHYESLNKEDRPKIKVQRFSNQPWKAVIVPKDFMTKLERACEKKNIDIEEAISLALLKLLYELRGKKLEE